MSARALGSACGKTILFGEHAVVYGRRAIAAAIDRGLTVSVTASSSRDTQCSPLESAEGADGRLARAAVRAAEMLGLLGREFSISVESELPAGVGLGSSAALSVALVRALSCFAARRLDDGAVCAMAYELEKIFHGFPSGIDNTVATYGGLVVFKKGEAVRSLESARNLPLVIAVGRAPRQTREAVTALRRRWSAHPKRYDALFDDIGALVEEAAGALFRGEMGLLGTLMSANHGLLQKLGVSTAELDALVDLALAHGAIGAKLTGGGGGGAVICLCPDDRAALLDAFTRAGWSAFCCDIAATSSQDDRRSAARAV